jgi:hypothetical protein
MRKTYAKILKIANAQRQFYVDNQFDLTHILDDLVAIVFAGSWMSWATCVRPVRRRVALPTPEQAPREHVRGHHQQPELQRMGNRLR